MLFNSLTFALFFIVTTLAYFGTSYKYRWIALLLSSYFFYCVNSSIKYIIILFMTTLSSYYCGILMGRKEKGKKRKKILIIGIMFDMGLLLLFKYLKFFTIISMSLLSYINMHPYIPQFNWIVPLGISFYTLQTVSYLIDVYNDKIPPEKHLGYFALYVSFFLTIFSGPIERGNRLIYELHKKNDFDYNRITDGFKLIAWGLLKKIVIADRLSIYVNQVYNNVQIYKGWTLLIATFFFGIQLYCDFSGYTDMAIGLGKVLGYEIMKNFDLPYFSKSVQEFWRRWHISLSTWFRDYLYIPLGGNRCTNLRNYLNLFIVFVASGLWHGANFTFIIWGGLHGLYQIMGKVTEKMRLRIFNKSTKYINIYLVNTCKMIVTFCLVNFAWIFFRANSLTDACYIVANLFTDITNITKENIMIGTSSYDFLLMILSVLIILVIELLDYTKKEFFLYRIKSKPGYYRWIIYYLVAMSILTFEVIGSNTFIYSNF